MKKLVSGLTAGILLFCGTVSVFAQSPIEQLAQEGILTGFEDGSLQPQATLTRGEFAKLLASALELEKETPLSFTDLPPDHWAYGAVAACAAAELLQGFDDGTFRPEDPVTYEQAAKTAVSFNRSYTSLPYPAGPVAAAIDQGCLDHINGRIGHPLTRE